MFAAVAMRTIWVLGYILGFSQVAWFRAYAHGAGLSPVAEEEIATGIMWAGPARRPRPPRGWNTHSA